MKTMSFGKILKCRRTGLTRLSKNTFSEQIIRCTFEKPEPQSYRQHTFVLPLTLIVNFLRISLASSHKRDGGILWLTILVHVPICVKYITPEKRSYIATLREVIARNGNYWQRRQICLFRFQNGLLTHADHGFFFHF